MTGARLAVLWRWMTDRIQRADNWAFGNSDLLLVCPSVRSGRSLLGHWMMRRLCHICLSYPDLCFNLQTFRGPPQQYNIHHASLLCESHPIQRESLSFRTGIVDTAYRRSFSSTNQSPLKRSRWETAVLGSQTRRNDIYRRRITAHCAHCRPVSREKSAIGERRCKGDGRESG